MTLIDNSVCRGAVLTRADFGRGPLVKIQGHCSNITTHLMSLAQIVVIKKVKTMLSLYHFMQISC